MEQFDALRRPADYASEGWWTLFSTFEHKGSYDCPVPRFSQNKNFKSSLQVIRYGTVSPGNSETESSIQFEEPLLGFAYDFFGKDLFWMPQSLPSKVGQIFARYAMSTEQFSYQGCFDHSKHIRASIRQLKIDYLIPDQPQVYLGSGHEKTFGRWALLTLAADLGPRVRGYAAIPAAEIGLQDTFVEERDILIDIYDRYFLRDEEVRNLGGIMRSLVAEDCDLHLFECAKRRLFADIKIWLEVAASMPTISSVTQQQFLSFALWSKDYLSIQKHQLEFPEHTVFVGGKRFSAAACEPVDPGVTLLQFAQDKLAAPQPNAETFEA